MTIEIPDITAAYVQEYREVEAELQIYTNEYLMKCSRQEQIRYNNLWYRRDYPFIYIRHDSIPHTEERRKRSKVEFET